MRTRVWIVMAVLAGTLLAVPSAQAALISGSGGQWSFSGRSAGSSVTVTFGQSQAFVVGNPPQPSSVPAYVFTAGGGETITAPGFQPLGFGYATGCQGSGSSTVYCSVFGSDGAQVTRLIATGGGSADVLDASAIAVPVVLTGGGGPDTLKGGSGNDVLDGGAGSDQMDGGTGADTVSYATHPTGVTVTLGTGRDDGVQDSAYDGDAGLRDGTANIEAVVGTDSADRLVGTAAAETLVGGAGDDVLTGGLGTDLLRGGEGVDLADYGERTTGVAVTLDGFPDDGEPGEADTLETVEGVQGGSGADALTGSARADLLDGGPGDDTVAGLGGADQLRGGAGADVVDARDGAVDGVDCGSETDAATIDAGDVVSNCESTSTGAVAPVVLPAPVQVISPLAAVGARVTARARAAKRYSVLRELAVRGLPAQATVVVGCASARRAAKARRCPRNVPTTFRPKAAAQASLLRPFRGRRLAVGTRITVTVAAAEKVTKRFVVTLRAGRAPSVATRCLPTAGPAQGTAC